MSVRAYILREKDIWVDEESKTFEYNNNDNKNLVKYTHEDLEYAINIWHQDELIQAMLNYGAEDYTNHDFIGEIEMGLEDFNVMLECCSIIWTQEDWESIKLIQKYFEEGNEWLILKCY